MTEENTTDAKHPLAIEGSTDVAAFMELASRAYGWSVFTNGEIAGLVAGDMGYDSCNNQWGHLISKAMGAADADTVDKFHEKLAEIAELCVAAFKHEMKSDQNLDDSTLPKAI